MTRYNWAQIFTFMAGVAYLLVVLSLFLTPVFFYNNIGHFEDYNRHYMGDTASFTLALAVGLIIAARDPVRHRLVIGLSLLASVVHTLNHVYDAVFNGMTNGPWLMDFTPLVLLLAAIAYPYFEPGAQRT